MHPYFNTVRYSEAPLALSEYQSFSMLQERVAYLRNCATLLHSPRVGRFLQNFKRRPRKLFFTANDDLCHAFLEFRALDWKSYAADIKVCDPSAWRCNCY